MTAKILLTLLLAIPLMVSGQQSSIKILAEVPVQFGLGYEGQISKRFSVSMQAGVLTEPNSTLIVNVLESLGTDNEIVLMIDNAFKLGFVGELGLNYNFKRNYIGAFAQVINLQGGDAPSDIIETYFNEDLSTYPVKVGQRQTNEALLRIQSTLLQAGVLYGRRFPLKNKHFEIATEIALSANIGSSSSLSSETSSLEALSVEVDNELKYYYSHYAFIPTITLGLVYKFQKNNSQL
jgi:hypothetical protein